METKAFVKIQSMKTINVTAGLQVDDVTNVDAHVPDRLKVNPLWPKLTVLIRQGIGWYPSEIAEWNTVKALVKDKIITISEYSDTPEDEATNNVKENLIRNMEETNVRSRKGKSLSEVAKGV